MNIATVTKTVVSHNHDTKISTFYLTEDEMAAWRTMTDELLLENNMVIAHRRIKEQLGPDRYYEWVKTLLLGSVVKFEVRP